jgi:hypothetical protein
MVVAAGLPSLSSTSASSASSGARSASTMDQKAAVFGGGAFGSKPDRFSCARYAATLRLPHWSYQLQSLFQ